jgi:hypothetical protein
MRELFCKKRHISIQNLDQCQKCVQNGCSGFVDKELCQEFNLCYVQEPNNVSNNQL